MYDALTTAGIIRRSAKRLIFGTYILTAASNARTMATAATVPRIATADE